MSKDLIIVILALAFAGAAAAMLVAIAKWQEEKEHRWDEISLRLNVENELEQSKAREKRTAQSVQWYADQLAVCEWRRRRAKNKNRDLQDRLSALLCPRNDHIWVGGVCKRCGRMRDAKLD